MVDVHLQTVVGHVWAGGLRFDAEKLPKMQKPAPYWAGGNHGCSS